MIFPQEFNETIPQSVIDNFNYIRDFEFYLSKNYPDCRKNNNALFVSYIVNMLGINLSEEDQEMIIKSMPIETLTRARRKRIEGKLKNKQYTIFPDESSRDEEKGVLEKDHRGYWGKEE